MGVSKGGKGKAKGVIHSKVKTSKGKGKGGKAPQEKRVDPSDGNGPFSYASFVRYHGEQGEKLYGKRPEDKLNLPRLLFSPKTERVLREKVRERTLLPRPLLLQRRLRPRPRLRRKNLLPRNPRVKEREQRVKARARTRPVSQVLSRESILPMEMDHLRMSPSLSFMVRNLDPLFGNKRDLSKRPKQRWKSKYHARQVLYST